VKRAAEPSVVLARKRVAQMALANARLIISYVAKRVARQKKNAATIPLAIHQNSSNVVAGWRVTWSKYVVLATVAYLGNFVARVSVCCLRRAPTPPHVPQDAAFRARRAAETPLATLQIHIIAVAVLG